MQRDMLKIPLVRGKFLFPFIEATCFSNREIESLLMKNKLPIYLYGKQDCYVPLRNAVQFSDAARRMRGSYDVGYLLSKKINFEYLSDKSQSIINGSPDLYSALQNFSARAQIENTDLLVKIEFHGSSLRVCGSFKNTSALQNIENLQWINNLILIEIVRQFAGNDWMPECMAFNAYYMPSDDVRAIWSRCKFTSAHREAWIEIPICYLSMPPINKKIFGKENKIDVLNYSNSLIDALRLMLPSYLDGKVPTVFDIAEMANASTRSLQRALADSGLSYRGILNEIKFNKAMHLLTDSDTKIVDVALSLGYSDAAHFTRAFQKIAGVPPLRFRVFSKEMMLR